MTVWFSLSLVCSLSLSVLSLSQIRECVVDLILQSLWYRHQIDNRMCSLYSHWPLMHSQKDLRYVKKHLADCMSCSRITAVSFFDIVWVYCHISSE